MDEPQAHHNWFARLEQERKDAAEQAKATLRSLCKQLARLGAQEVRLVYDGYGDSGVMENVTAMSDGQEIPLEESLRNEFHNAAYDLLPSGWEINEGSFGVLVLKVDEDRIVREHNWRIEETEYEEEEWEL
jgi:hypothetical protein